MTISEWGRVGASGGEWRVMMAHPVHPTRNRTHYERTYHHRVRLVQVLHEPLRLLLERRQVHIVHLRRRPEVFSVGCPE